MMSSSYGYRESESAWAIVFGPMAVLATIFALTWSTTIANRYLGFSSPSTILSMGALAFGLATVVCAYVGYKATDAFSLMARDVLGFDEVTAAGIGTLTFWIRAIVAVGAGYLADLVDSSRVIAWGFAILVAGSGLIASGLLAPGVAWMLISTIVATSVGVYALRAVYFALLAEGAVPLAFTGSAIGVASGDGRKRRSTRKT